VWRRIIEDRPLFDGLSGKNWQGSRRLAALLLYDNRSVGAADSEVNEKYA
jgi:hypothetical protein